jgi:hypothetical protein
MVCASNCVISIVNYLLTSQNNFPENSPMNRKNDIITREMNDSKSLSRSNGDHNLWDGYGFVILLSRLKWINLSNPKIYRVYDKNGRFQCEASSFSQEEIDKYLRSGSRIELQDNSKLIIELEETIHKLRNK